MGRYENEIKKKGSFVNRNLVAIVMIPSLIALHYGWAWLQQNDALVKKEERIDLPVVTAARHLWKKLQGGSGDDASK